MIYHYQLGTVQEGGIMVIKKSIKIMWSVTVWTFVVAGWMIFFGLVTGVITIDQLLVP